MSDFEMPKRRPCDGAILVEWEATPTFGGARKMRVHVVDLEIVGELCNMCENGRFTLGDQSLQCPECAGRGTTVGQTMLMSPFNAVRVCAAMAFLLGIDFAKGVAKKIKF